MLGRIARSPSNVSSARHLFETTPVLKETTPIARALSVPPKPSRYLLRDGRPINQQKNLSTPAETGSLVLPGLDR